MFLFLPTSSYHVKRLGKLAQLSLGINMSTNRVYVSVDFILHEEYCTELVFSY